MSSLIADADFFRPRTGMRLLRHLHLIRLLTYPAAKIRARNQFREPVRHAGAHPIPGAKPGVVGYGEE
jgi:hypothetical protein